MSGTRICISLEADENQAECGRTWFDFSTPYSSYDGAGFYCMPEIGDTVRLYFPTCDEKKACGFSAVNREERQNPEIKYLMNKEGKQLILAPDYIRLTNNAGMSLELNDHAGIRIESWTPQQHCLPATCVMIYATLSCCGRMMRSSGASSSRAT